MTFICTKSCFSVLIHTRHWFFWRNNSLRYSSSLFHYEPWRRCCSFHPEFWKPCLSFPSPQTIAWGCPRQHESCGEKVGPGLGAGAAPNAEDPTRSPPPHPTLLPAPSPQLWHRHLLDLLGFWSLQSGTTVWFVFPASCRWAWLERPNI